MTSRWNTFLLATVFGAIGATASAGVLFTDGFERAAVGFNSTPDGWQLTHGSVDVVGPGLYADLCAGSGTCVDLDGSSGVAGTIGRQFDLRAGVHYVARFDLAGNRRQSGSESGEVTFGTSSMRYLLDATQTSYVNYMLSFQPIASGPAALTFSAVGDDFGGAILDNIVIEQLTVAAPAPGGLFGMAMAGGAFCARRSRLRHRCGNSRTV